MEGGGRGAASDAQGGGGGDDLFGEGSSAGPERILAKDMGSVALAGFASFGGEGNLASRIMGNCEGYPIPLDLISNDSCSFLGD